MERRYTANWSPPPTALRRIRELGPEADRQLTILADRNRGPVWLLTGFLHTQCSYDGYKAVPDHLIRRIKTQHWRSAVGHHSLPGWRQATLHIIDDLRIPFCDVMSDEYRRELPDGAPPRPWEDFDAYYKFIYDLITKAKREGHNIRYWEVWNEPDHVRHSWSGTREQFFETFKVAHDAVLAADPEGWVGGPSWKCAHGAEGVAEYFSDFLRYCQQHDVQLDFLVWHELHPRPEVVPQHAAAVRKLVEQEFADLGVKEYRINEWGRSWRRSDVGPGTQVAFFYYLDQAGIDRAAKTFWDGWYLDGILADPTTPKAAYWAWAAYADGVGVRLITRTNDKRLVALASRDEQGTVRVLIGRAENPAGPQPPVKAKVVFRGLPFAGGRAQVEIVHLASDERPFAEEELAEHTHTEEVRMVGHSASLVLPTIKENEVYSLTLRGPTK